MRERLITCRYLRRNGNQCTAEAVDPDGEIVLCMHHLGRVVELLRRGREQALASNRE